MNGVSNHNKKALENFRRALTLLQESGYGGQYVYVPTGRKKRAKRKEEIKKMLKEGYSVREITKKIGVSSRYVYWIKQKMLKSKELFYISRK